MQNVDFKLSFEPHSIQNFDTVMVDRLFEAVIVFGSIIVLTSLDKEVSDESLALLPLFTSLS
jgi:hypothetical protein